MAGNGRQIGIQIVGALFIIGWNIAWTSLIMIFIKYVCRVPLRMSDEDLAVGDFAIHGEEPYTFEYYNRAYRTVAGYGHPPTRASGSGFRGDGAEDAILGADPERGLVGDPGPSRTMGHEKNGMEIKEE